MWRALLPARKERRVDGMVCLPTGGHYNFKGCGAHEFGRESPGFPDFSTTGTDYFRGVANHSSRAKQHFNKRYYNGKLPPEILEVVGKPGERSRFWRDRPAVSGTGQIFSRRPIPGSLIKRQMRRSRSRFARRQSSQQN